MAHPGPNNPKHNKTPQSNTWWPFIFKSGATAGVLCGAYYYYKTYMHVPQSIQSNDDDRPFTMYNPTPLGDFDDTDDTSNTTFYTANTSGDGVKMGVREEYIGNLLQQRRTLSVLKNPHLNHPKIEHYFHLGFDSSSPILSHFNRVKWVIIVRSKSDVHLVGQRILSEFPQFKQEKDDNSLPKPIGSTDRFYMLQIASIIIVSCGIGAASISILLQEMTKVLVDAGAFAPNENNSSLNYQTSYVEYILLVSAPGIKQSPNAKAYKRRNSLKNISEKNALKDPRPRRNSFRKFSDLKADIRSGVNNEMKESMVTTQRPSLVTNGEIPVFIPTECYNEKLQKKRDFTVCGENLTRAMKFDRNLISDIKQRCNLMKWKPKTGKGLSVQYFNEALSYNSVSIAQETNIKSKFIQSCINQGVKYVDMESGYFAAFCNELNVSCVALVGIEYDISAPSKGNNNMRVSKDSALQATLDIFCQYLFDRIAKDLKNKNMKGLKRAMSGGDAIGNDVHVPELNSSRSVPMEDVNMNMNGNMEDSVDHSAPAAFENDINDFDNEDEGSNDV